MMRRIILLLLIAAICTVGVRGDVSECAVGCMKKIVPTGYEGVS